MLILILLFSMLLLSDIGYTTYPFPAFAFPLMLNSLVHVFLYAYYGLSAAGHTPGWKKRLTEMQVSKVFAQSLCSNLPPDRPILAGYASRIMGLPRSRLLHLESSLRIIHDLPLRVLLPQNVSQISEASLINTCSLTSLRRLWIVRSFAPCLKCDTVRFLSRYKTLPLRSDIECIVENTLSTFLTVDLKSSLNMLTAAFFTFFLAFTFVQAENLSDLIEKIVSEANDKSKGAKGKEFATIPGPKFVLLMANYFH